MEKSQLEEKAKEVFDHHKDATMLYATSDGTFFLESSKSMAYSHGKNTGLKVSIIYKNGEPESDESLSLDQIKVAAKENGFELVEQGELSQLKEEKPINPILASLSVDEIKVIAEVRGIDLQSEDREDLLTELEIAIDTIH